MSGALYAIVRIRGSVKMKASLRDTLRMLRLTSVNHCVLYQKSESIDGMLNRVVPWVTWGEIDAGTLAELVEKRGRKGRQRLDAKEVREVSSKILQQKSTKDAAINPVFRLNPPSRGHKRIKGTYPNGAAGYRGEAIKELLKRMM
ncbi:MAG: 50S ribosomal protein L30 [Candidatus Aenigmarchaeota archaeon]|nr:50S ribosomal protein L30 [Candidatus Aenigmarchaeota archaeon]